MGYNRTAAVGLVLVLGSGVANPDSGLKATHFTTHAIPRNMAEDADPELERLLPVEVRTPSPGELRAQGVVYMDRETRESIRMIGRCSYEVSYRLSDGQMRTRTVEFGCRVLPRVSVALEPAAGEEIVYTYAITNEGGSPQNLRLFSLRTPDGAVVIDEQRQGVAWPLPQAARGGGIAFGPLAGAAALRPGETLKGVSITSKYLPGVMPATFRGDVPRDPNAEPLEVEWSEFLETALSKLDAEGGGAVVATIGPAIAPPGSSVTSREGVAEKLLDDIDRATAAGLATANGGERLRILLESARRNVMNGETLRALAVEVQGIEGVDESYRRATEVALMTLADGA